VDGFVAGHGVDGSGAMPISTSCHRTTMTLFRLFAQPHWEKGQP
jgi:hypothetical protein